MEIVETIIKATHIVVSILLIIAVLLQPGKGDIGSVFGGTTESIFGASGAVPFLTKVTRILAVLFIASSLSLGYLATKGIKSSVVKDPEPITLEEKSETATKGQNPSETSSTPAEEMPQPGVGEGEQGQE